jgi:hypothetical protein
MAQEFPSQELLRRIRDEPGDPTVSLSAIREIRTWLDIRELHFVERARSEGLSWHGIAKHLGRSKQAVWERYRNPSDSSDSNING